LVSGERRFRASKLIGLQTIPAYIRIANDQESLEMALVENIQRQDLDPIEIALSYQRLIDEIALTQEQMSDRVGKKRSTIANYLRLLKLDPIIQTGMRDGFISMGHGRAMINIENQNDQLDIYEKIITDKLSVRATEQLVKSYHNPLVKKTVETSELPKFVRKGIKEFSEYFGHKIGVKVSKNGKGSITIPFHSEEDFNRIKKLVESAK
jgi:ParB family chromosome partitioning protein